MPCFKPLPAYQKGQPNKNGKYEVVVLPRNEVNFFRHPLRMPCGQCSGCRLARSRGWAVRCVHESSLYEHNCFITLTYSDEFLPSDLSLHYRDFQLFMKSLREYSSRVFNHVGIRFFMCGEYGELYKRPHFHAILFNFNFPDLVHWKDSNDVPVYRSKILEKLWPYGYSSVGTATFESAAYVARYVMKKITGDVALTFYANFDHDTGEILSDRTPEFCQMSRKPGIAKGWFDQFKHDVYGFDGVVLKGVQVPAPKYYDSQYEVLFPQEMSGIKERRILNALKHKENCTPERLEVRRIVKEKQIVALYRTLDLEL